MPKGGLKRIAIAYVPVLHKGYLLFFKNSRADSLYVIGEPFLKQLDYLRKDLRALKPSAAVELIKGSGVFKSVKVLKSADLAKIDQSGNQIMMPDEDISRAIGGRLKRASVDYSPVFLRWDRQNVLKSNKNQASEETSTRKKDRVIMMRANSLANASSDIWRRVGAILFDKAGREIGTETNRAEPSEHTPWIEGDPRNIYKQGLAIEVALFTHAEAALVAKAAKEGISLEGGTIYVTTFPCPVCARLIARSGIKNLYYGEGYGVLDGARILDDYGVHITRVPFESKSSHPQARIPYKKR